MKYIDKLRDGMHVREVYLCKNKQISLTKNGKEYGNLVFQDKTGTVDAKIWDLFSPGIEDFNALDYVMVEADVTTFNERLQLNVKRVSIASDREYDPADYVPVTKKNIEEMFKVFREKISGVRQPFLNKLLTQIFITDFEFQKKFKTSSAAKNVHHGFVGGLLEHTLSVVNLCEYFCRTYPVLNHDILITAAMCHDIGKTRELSSFPENDYTDEGQLIGHIIIGTEMVRTVAASIPGFPIKLLNEVTHCILAHHGELEYGSPKKPALIEAVALNLADNTDAKMETFIELLESAGEANGWLGFNRLLDSNIRKTSPTSK